MTDDPRKPKIVMPDDTSFLTVLKHKQNLDAVAQEKQKAEEASKKDKKNG